MGSASAELQPSGTRRQARPLRSANVDSCRSQQPSLNDESSACRTAKSRPDPNAVRPDPGYAGGMRMSRAIVLLLVGLCVAPLGAQAPSFVDAYREPVARRDRGGHGRPVRVEPPGAAHRHVRPPPQRLAGARRRHRLVGDDDESRRLRRGLDRPGEGPEVGPRRRVARPGRAARAPHPDAGPGHERGHARRRPRGRPARRRQLRRARAPQRRGARPHRAVQRAVSRLRPDRRLSHQRRLAGRSARRGRDAGALGRPRRPAHASHRHAVLSRRRARRFRRPRSRPKTRSGSRAWPAAVSACACA